MTLSTIPRGLCWWRALPTSGFFRLCSSSNYYSILGVGNDATKAEIKSAFLNLSKKHHPDLNPPSRSKHAHKKFRAINEAYSTLIDPAKRSVYDQQLRRVTQPHYTGAGMDNDRFGFYKYNAKANAYTYARAYKYYDFNDAEWEELYKKSGAFRPRRSHFGVVKMLILFMVAGTILHTTRFYFIHKNHQLKSQETTERNQAIYEAVRERGKTNTVQKQLERLAHDSKKSRTKQTDSKDT